MREHVGVYKRGDIWWYCVGRSIRRSSGSRNIEDALALRANALAIENNRFAHTDWKRQVSAQHETSKSWLRRAHASIKSRTKRRGWPGCITQEELAQLLLLSQGRCAITGLPFNLTAKVRDPFAISVDRIDSRMGYSYGNVRLVLLAVNLAMSHWGEAALMSIARALVGRELLSGGYESRHMDESTVEDE